jgi:hypothetical protein
VEFDERHICERVLALYYNLLGPPAARVAVASRIAVGAAAARVSHASQGARS